jgi:sugar lactone lactonase YvrE
MLTEKVELVVDAKAALGEGPCWDEKHQLLYWVDIMNAHVHIYNPVQKKNKTIDVGVHVGTVVPKESGGLIIALTDGIYSLDLETEKLSFVTHPESDLSNMRYNDGKCDPAGRFWVGSMAYDVTPEAASLYRMDTDFSTRRMVSQVTISNGLAWNLEKKKMYYIDTPTQQVVSFDYDIKTGDISNRQSVITIDRKDGSPDGMTIDAEGMLWVAHWGGSRVSRWNPDNGQWLDEIHLPVSRVTSCTFGGAALDELYITSAGGDNEAVLEKEPLAGGLFRVKTAVKGMPVASFKG